ncbi:MAG: hypothetical protein ACTSW1_13000 [Candidatus Hodarchaeales archaeon]
MVLDLSDIKNNNISLTVDDKSFQYVRKGLPPSIFNFLVDYRVKAIKGFQKQTKEGGGISSVTSMLHSPPLATRSPEGFFPVNTAAKGIGFVPKEEHLEKWVERFEVLINEAIENGEDTNKKERLMALADLYDSREELDPYVLGTLELYGFRSWRNMQYDPRVSVIYNTTEMKSPSRPNYISFEVKGIVEVVEKGSLRWRWQRNIHDLFHLWKAKERREGDWPVAVLNIHVLQTIDKRPFPSPSKEITK